MSSKGVNKAILIGNCGTDPEVRNTSSGVTIANLRIATSSSWRDKQSGNMREQTEWHRVVAFGKLGEICSEYLRKGSKVYIEGRLQTRKWQGQDGSDRYTTEIVAENMQMLDSRPQGEGGRFAGKQPVDGNRDNRRDGRRDGNKFDKRNRRDQDGNYKPNEKFVKRGSDQDRAPFEQTQESYDTPLTDDDIPF